MDAWLFYLVVSVVLLVVMLPTGFYLFLDKRVADRIVRLLLVLFLSPLSLLIAPAFLVGGTIAVLAESGSNKVGGLMVAVLCIYALLAVGTSCFAGWSIARQITRNDNHQEDRAVSIMLIIVLAFLFLIVQGVLLAALIFLGCSAALSGL